MIWTDKLIILLTLVSYCVSNAQKIIVYSGYHGLGNQSEISISECNNLPDDMAGTVTSINTLGNCARFYDEKDCSGSSIEVLRRSPSHQHLYTWGFDDKAMSVGPCPDECDVSITGIDGDEGVNLEIYTRKQFKGAYQELKVKGCTPIPTKFIFQLMSVKVFDKCLQFYNNLECKASGENVDTIELRKGTPNHYDISSWYFTEARAVSHCSYKCKEVVEPKSDLSGSPLEPNEVILFDGKDYAGNSVHLSVLNCTDILNEWEGAAVSIKTFNGSCVTLHQKRGCTGDSLNVNDFNPDLTVGSFDALTRSIRPCN